MAKKIENISTSELNAYRQTIELVCYKCDNMAQNAMQVSNKEPGLNFQDEFEKLSEIKKEYFNIGHDISMELEKRAKNHFGIKNSSLGLKNIDKSIRAKIQESGKKKSAKTESKTMEVIK